MIARNISLANDDATELNLLLLGALVHPIPSHPINRPTAHPVKEENVVLDGPSGGVLKFKFYAIVYYSFKWTKYTATVIDQLLQWRVGGYGQTHLHCFFRKTVMFFCWSADPGGPHAVLRWTREMAFPARR